VLRSLLLLCSIPAFATPILYTFQDTAAGGTLGTDGLSAITYTIEAQADSSQVTITLFSGGDIYSVPAEVTIGLTGEEGPGGFNPFHLGYEPISKVLTLTIPAIVTYNSTNNIVGISSGGIDITPNIFNMPLSNGTVTNWNLVTPLGPYSVISFFPLGGVNAPTNEGVLVSSDDNILPTFEASLDPGLNSPEPALGLPVGLALLAVAFTPRRRPLRNPPRAES
jgi:hypothetical protein